MNCCLAVNDRFGHRRCDARINHARDHRVDQGLASEGIDYTGVLYAGLMIGADGVARVIEFSCRLGDPETQPVLLRLQSDIVALCEAALDGSLHDDLAR